MDSLRARLPNLGPLAHHFMGPPMALPFRIAVAGGPPKKTGTLIRAPVFLPGMAVGVPQYLPQQLSYISLDELAETHALFCYTLSYVEVVLAGASH